jgi:hypothetical protein
MFLTATVLMLVLLVCWLSFSPLELKIDTRIPVIFLHWKTIAKLIVVFEYGEWWLKIDTLPYKNKWILFDLIRSKKKKKTKPAGARTQPVKRSSFKLKKVIKLLSSSKVKEWRFAFDSGDFTLNAGLFPLNFLPPFQQHLEINFINKNFLVLKITNSFWRLLNTWFK